MAANRYGFAFFLACFCIANSVWGDDHQSQSLVSPFVIESAWSPAAPPMVPVRAGYFTFINQSRVPVKIVGAQSSAFGRVELHESVITDGVTSMSAVDSITIDAGQVLEAKPGGLHLMLMEPKTVIFGTIPVILLFEQGGSVSISLDIKAKMGHQNSPRKHH